MNQNMNKNKKDEWLKEPVSEDLKNKIFAKVQVELKENKKQHLAKQAQEAPQSTGFWTQVLNLINAQAFSFAALALAIVGVLVFRSMNIIDVERPTTTFSELAALTPEEFEVIENLEYIEDLDEINLEDIRKEMRRANKANKG